MLTSTITLQLPLQKPSRNISSPMTPICGSKQATATVLEGHKAAAQVAQPQPVADQSLWTRTVSLEQSLQRRRACGMQSCSLGPSQAYTRDLNSN